MTGSGAADCSIESLQTGLLSVMALGAVTAFVITAAVVAHPWVFVASGLVGAGVGAGTARLLARRSRRHWDRVPSNGTGPVRRSRARGVRLGMLWGVATIAAGAVVLVVEVLVLDDREVYQVGSPLLLTFAVATAMSRRDLRRWQKRRGLVLCTRVGARRFAWTGSQARGRLVAVPLTDAGAVAT